MAHPAYKPPLPFVLRLKLQKGGAYLRDTMVHVQFSQLSVCDCGWSVRITQVLILSIVPTFGGLFSLPLKVS